MPKTFGAIILLLLAVLPGVPGERAYSKAVGLDWREEAVWRATRIALISMLGLIAYIFIASVFSSFPLPTYAVPESAGVLTTSDLPSIAVAYAGHLLLSYLVGKGAGYVANRGTGTPRPAVWDGLVSEYVSGRWIVVTLENGQSFAGMLEAADVEAPREDCDVLLSEPALYEQDKSTFVSFEYQYLYLPAANISSVAIYHDPDLDDDRLTPVNQPLFRDDEREQQQ